MPRLPGAFLVLGIGIAASAMFDLKRYGVATVGVIDLTPHWQALAMPTFRQFSAVAQLAIPLVLILFAESWGTIRTLALKHNDTVDPDRELGALGLSNIAAALVQGMPVGAGFSAGSMAEGAGSQSRLTGGGGGHAGVAGSVRDAAHRAVAATGAVGGGHRRAAPCAEPRADHGHPL